MIEDEQADVDSSEDEQRRWNDLVCEVTICTGEAAIDDWRDKSRRSIEGGVGLFNFDKGFIDTTEEYPPSINCWFTLDNEEFQDVWQRISSGRQPEYLLTLTVEEGVHNAGEYFRDLRWNVKMHQSLKILSVDLRFTYAAPDDFKESIDRLRRRGWGTANIDNALKRNLDEHLLKPPKDKENSWSFYSQFTEVAKQVARNVAQ
ncbi:MAG: hypothetical protein ACE5H7_18300, partial [Acidiferrobacterales bacterium]